MQLHDEDIEDLDAYSEEEFHEDNLNDQDYDKLYKFLPELRTQLASYNDDIPDIDLKEALYFNYFDIENSLNEIKSKFPKKKSTYFFIN